MKTGKKSKVPWVVIRLTRTRYEELCARVKTPPLTDDECVDFFVAYSLKKHGSSTAVRAHFMRGHTIAHADPPLFKEAIA